MRSAEDGRFLLLRGVCFGPSAKLPPYLPVRSPEDLNKFDPYLDLLLACGLTTLRLAFLWAALEPTFDPQSPRYDERFLEEYFQTVRHLSDKGFTIIIDLHQDLVGAEFGGGGMPEWVHAEGAASRVWLKDTPLWGLNYMLNRALRRTFTAFWANDLTNLRHDPPLKNFPVRDRFLDALERLAIEAAKIDRVLGIEIFNEPHPAQIEERAFEERVLPHFYEQALDRVRRHSSDLFVLVSPASDWNVNLRQDRNYRSHLTGMESDTRVMFAYHYYDSIMTGFHGLGFHDHKREEYVDAHRLGVRGAQDKQMVPFLTEFGTRQNWFRTVVRRHMNWQFEAVEAAAVHATYWNVNLYNTFAAHDGFMKEDFSLLGPYDHASALPQARNLDIATRPYVVAASAEPEFMHFNLRTKEFVLTLRGRPVPEPTVLYLPATARHPMQPVHYPDGFVVLYNGEVIEPSFTDDHLELTLDPERDLHEIIVRSR